MCMIGLTPVYERVCCIYLCVSVCVAYLLVHLCAHVLVQLYVHVMCLFVHR